MPNFPFSLYQFSEILCLSKKIFHESYILLRWDSAFTTFISFRQKIIFPNPEYFFHLARYIKDTLKCLSMFFAFTYDIRKWGNFEDFWICDFSPKVLYFGRMFAKTGNNHGQKIFHGVEVKWVYETQKSFPPYLQPLSGMRPKFHKSSEQDLYKIPHLTSELLSCISPRVFWIFTGVFWQRKLVRLTHKCITVWMQKAPSFEIHLFSQTFAESEEDWRKS